MMLDRPLELIRERLRRSPDGLDPLVAARAAVDWLFAAQDATGDGGVSHSYLIGQGWMRSYPETTGYIIPTLLDVHRAVGDAEAEKRALRMADWEIEGQLESGAVPELVGGHPTVFDTGQVVFGWVAAFRHTGEERYLEAARRGVEWLLGELDHEGIWRHRSDSGGPGRVYNARVAWSLLEFGRVAGDDRVVEPMRHFLDWTLAQERSDGWFDRNCLTDDAAPLLHTIAYTARGHLEAARLTGDARYRQAAERTASHLLEALESDGSLAGRFARDFVPVVRWRCLTGMAQTSIVWRRLAAMESTPPDEAARFRDAADRVNRWLIAKQDRSSSNPGLRGGIRGSYPVNGAYGRWRVLNWATKFFVDAILIAGDDDALEYAG